MNRAAARFITTNAQTISVEITSSSGITFIGSSDAASQHRSTHKPRRVGVSTAGVVSPRADGPDTIPDLTTGTSISIAGNDPMPTS
jgi:hypothetical protein